MQNIIKTNVFICVGLLIYLISLIEFIIITVCNFFIVSRFISEICFLLRLEIFNKFNFSTKN